MESYYINIQGLSNKIHQFEFELGDAFFKAYGTDLVSEGNLEAKITLDKHETFIETTFSITGFLNLVCDRSLETFEFPVEISEKIIFKFGHEEAEISDDVMMLPFHAERIELGQLMYEFIGLSVPMKKLHPRFHPENEEEGIVFSSNTDDEKQATDPRWEILKKLNKNK